MGIVQQVYYECISPLHLTSFSGFIAGALVELYGNRVVPAVGTVLATLGFVLTAVAQNVGTLFFTYSILTGKEIKYVYFKSPMVAMMRSHTTRVSYGITQLSTIHSPARNAYRIIIA